MTTTARESPSTLPASPFAAALTRRQLLQGSVAAAMLAMFGGAGCAAPGGARPLGFKSVPLSAADTLVVPDGYRADVLYAWGDPVGHASGSPPFRFDASNTAEEQALQAGMHHDGMQFYPLPYGSDDASHGLLALNHEYHSDGLLFPDGAANWSATSASTRRSTRTSPTASAGSWRSIPTSRTRSR